jgi:hypothetical protein
VIPLVGRSLPAAAVFVLTGCTPAVGPMTGLEQSGFQRPSTPEQIVGFLGDLARRSDRTTVLRTGRSAGGRPLAAAIVAPRAREHRTPPVSRRLTVLLVGSQHGNEPSGGEALQILAREIATGPRAAYLDDFDLIIVPDANPDGRAARRRGNARGVNLSTAFVVSAEPETQALLDLLRNRAPDVVLDVHESAILKKSTLARQGYVTDVEAQLEGPTNPDVDPGLRALSDSILQESIARTERAGLPAQRYLGEITDIRQPIIRGGPTLNNLRNMAGMYGTLSLLLENRLDPRGKPFPTPRNIRVRVDKQLLAITAFLDTCRDYRPAIAAAVDAAREVWRRDGEQQVHLRLAQLPNPRQQEIVVPLRRLADGAPEALRFELRDVVEGQKPLRLPRAYAITAHQESMRPVLDRHRIAYQVLTRPLRAITRPLGQNSSGQILTVQPGALWIDLRQPARRLIPLLIDPESHSGIFRQAAFAVLLARASKAFVLRIDAIVTNEPSPGDGRRCAIDCQRGSRLPSLDAWANVVEAPSSAWRRRSSRRSRSPISTRTVPRASSTCRPTSRTSFSPSRSPTS